MLWASCLGLVAKSGCQKASVGAPRWFVSKPEAACASGARPSAKEDVDATIVRCNRLADDINPIKKFLGFTYIGFTESLSWTMVW